MQNGVQASNRVGYLIQDYLHLLSKVCFILNLRMAAIPLSHQLFSLHLFNLAPVCTPTMLETEH